MSAGELFDLIMPLVFVLSTLISTWVLASARKRFSLLYAFALAGGTLLLPLILFPIYLVIMMWRPKRGPPPRGRYLLPLLYASVLLAGIAVFYYVDTRTVDAHLARATRAKLVEDTTTAVSEYRQALALEENAHTHKLLAIELANAGNVEEAISEFRLAQQGGEPDDSINYRLGLLFERMSLHNQAQLEFAAFLLTETCRSVDSRCEAAEVRISTNQR